MQGYVMEMMPVVDVPQVVVTEARSMSLREFARQFPDLFAKMAAEAYGEVVLRFEFPFMLVSVTVVGDYTAWHARGAAAMDVVEAYLPDLEQCYDVIKKDPDGTGLSAAAKSHFWHTMVKMSGKLGGLGGVMVEPRI